MKCCKDDPKKQAEIQKEEFKQELNNLPENHKTEELLIKYPQRLNPQLNNPCNALTNLKCLLK